MERIRFFLERINHVRFVRYLLFLFLGLFLFAALYVQVKPRQYELRLFDIATETIRSPITIEDKETTEKLKKEAANKVADVYTLKKEYAENRVDLISSLFTTIVEIQDEAKGKNKEQAEMVDKLKERLPQEWFSYLSESEWEKLLQADPEDINTAKEAAVTSVHSIMAERITKSELEKARAKVQDELKYIILPPSLEKIVIKLTKQAIIPNVIYDRAATEEKRRQAMDEVKPVKILQGQIIVEEGQFITNEIYRQLQLVGLLENERSFQPLIGLFLFVLLLLSPVVYYFGREKTNMNLFVYATIFTIMILVMELLRLIPESDAFSAGYLVPVAFGTMLVRIFIGERMAIITSILFAVCGSLMFNEEFGTNGTMQVSLAVYLVTSGLAGSFFLHKQLRKAKIWQAGVFVAFINVVVMLALNLLKNGHYSLAETGMFLLMAVASGIFSAILTIGLLPVLEASFGILSSMKLIELSNPNHPLLRKILTEAPGTYHHSIMVANLAEAACEAIGANGLLARVACYYHDIGKTKRPRYFIENQIGSNPHDHLSPQLSKNIILAHVSDGVAILKKHRMPKEIIDIAEQHHGTTLLKYFYHKALEQMDYVPEEEFRYPGPKPQTKEAAIVSIADSVEAVVRSLSNPSQEKIEKIVRGIIAERLQDNQLNECDITLKELETVATSLCETLNGVFHSRIEYPEIRKEKVRHA
ncbi:HD family phosphohydrolase [Parageobacillus thermoglucosidasius]|uniref:HD family phosphohydrolase n=2 Tax=Anoxybacillaceae TaxID=3120669 RepID=A0AB38QYY9_PARTM|nr:HD family phosphohydrolase [Parageobacillus thermoglucosidasius]AEH47179.1 7TM receptor with intracellular metal dependent phosphohydrolase [Parageobacillus thermoglucosidasius C56-YS93]MED4905105.1 HD family phosphohydrolase [Parageobacillus thermoglucosidasius]MED4913330.1 HD family phosphohydrolase [Parageobacillus thermoglucosidasius]MED4944631.1 HD family phosphohydrolase [Parageobacillus thermoglucosidasius]MED4982436.1 HD family phosphohydrolase [Parageobacillus thermoglucosidasius]